MKTPFLLALAAIVMACSSPTELARDAAALMVTDATEYQLVADEHGVYATIRYIYSNRTGKKISLVTCGRPPDVPAPPPALEKLVDGRWEHAWSMPVAACLGAPAEIPPGDQYRDVLSLVAAHPELNAGPKFADPDLEGTYRLRWGGAYWHYNHDGPPFGEPVPRRYLVSNSFRLLAPVAVASP